MSTDLQPTPRDSAEQLVLYFHGSADPLYQADITRFVAQVAQTIPDLQISAAFIENASPALSDHVASLPADSRVHVLPVLLSKAYHSTVDVARNIDQARAQSPRQRIHRVPTLGLNEAIADAARERLAEVGDPGELLVFAAAGTSYAEARAEFERGVRQRFTQPDLRIAYATGPVSLLRDVLPELLREHPEHSVIVVPWLFARGKMHDILRSAIPVDQQHRVRLLDPLIGTPSIVRAISTHLADYLEEAQQLI